MRNAIPFVIVLSSHLAAGLTEAIIAPVMRGRTTPVTAFEIPIEDEDEILLIGVSGMTAIRQVDLRRRIGSAAHHEDAIRRALDRLFTGF